ncbi:MAG: YfhO family protein, partial [Chloroflexota bacterium]
GIVPFLLMLAAPFLRRRARTWFFFIFGLLSLSFALGDANPLYGILAYIPLYNRFRVPARFMYPFIFTAAFLAAECFDELRRRLRDVSSADRVTMALCVGFTLSIIAIMIAWERLPLAWWMNAWTMLPLGLILFALGVLAVALARRIAAPRFAVVVVGLTLVDYALFSAPLSYTINAQVTPEEFLQAPLVVQKMDATRPLDRMFTNIYNLTLRPNHPMIYRRPSAQIYSPLALQRGEDYGAILTAAAFNLANVRYYFLPSGPLPEEFSEPTASLVLDLFPRPSEIPPTRVAQLEITSYTDQTTDLPDGFLVGEIILSSRDAQSLTLPLRLGIETADWAHAGLGARHAKPRAAISFPAYLLSLRREFEGFKYVTRYTLPTPFEVVTVSARSFLPEGNLVIERVLFFDQVGQSASLAALTHRNDFAVTFKSHAVTTLENRDVMSRAFIVHAAEIVGDEQALARLRDSSFRPDQVVLLSEGAPLRAPDNAPSYTTDRATIVEYKPERVVVQTQTERAGYLILADTFYPGWEARLDGQSVPIWRADYMFRAVALPPGAHSIEFEFRPPLLVWGALISVASGLVGLVLLGRGFRRF